MHRQQERNLFCKKESQSIILLETFVSILPSGWFLFSGWPQLQLTHGKCLSQETKANFPGQGSNLAAQSKVKCAKHEATVPHTKQQWFLRKTTEAALIMDENNIYGYNKGDI